MRKLRRLGILIVVAILTYTMTGCGEVRKAENSVNNMFKAFQNLDFEVSKEYIDLEEVEEQDDINAKAIMENLFQELEYQIISSEKIDKDTVNVKVKITAVDMKPIFRDFFVDYIAHAFSYALSGDEMTEEEQEAKMQEILLQSIKDRGSQTVTNEVVLEVNRQGKVWKVESSDTFVNALLGDFEKVVEEIQNSLDS